MGLGAKGSGLECEGLRFGKRVQVSGFMVLSLGFWVWGLGFRGSDFGFRVQSWFQVAGFKFSLDFGFRVSS